MLSSLDYNSLESNYIAKYILYVLVRLTHLAIYYFLIVLINYLVTLEIEIYINFRLINLLQT